MPSVTRVVVIGLSNIGDAVLMSPVVERLHRSFPQAQLTVLVGERAQALFAGDPRIHQLVCLDEFEGWGGRLRLVWLIWKNRPDVLIDLRQTILPLLWKPWRAWRYFWPLRKDVVHRRQRHLLRCARQLGRLGRAIPPPIARPEGPIAAFGGTIGGGTVWIGPEERATAEMLRGRWGLDANQPLVVICPGARSHIKRWYADRFAALADRLIEEAGVEIVFTGEPDEAPIIQDILKTMRHRAHSAGGRTTIRQLGALMQRAGLVVTNDSASLHLACAVGAPVLALFGPTDPQKYGPTGPRDRVIQRRLFCVPCEEALCRFSHECMRFIGVDEVYETAREMLGSGKWKVESGRSEGQ